MSRSKNSNKYFEINKRQVQKQTLNYFLFDYSYKFLKSRHVANDVLDPAHLYPEDAAKNFKYSEKTKTRANYYSVKMLYYTDFLC